MTVREEHKQKVAGGAEHVLYKGLLAMAHEKWGTKWSMESKILQFPNDGNGHTTICQATLVLEGGQTFVEIGDANPGNVGRNIAPHSIRMASTRAKGRVLRDGLNIGEAMHEEFGGDAEQAPRQQGRSTSQAGRRQQRSGQQAQGQRQQQSRSTSQPQNSGGNVSQMRGAAKTAKRPDPKRPRPHELSALKTLIRELFGTDEDPERGLRAWEAKRTPFDQMSRQEVLDAIDELTPEAASEAEPDDVDLGEEDLEEIEQMVGG